MYNDFLIARLDCRSVVFTIQYLRPAFVLFPKRRDVTQPFRGISALHHASVNRCSPTWR